MEEHAEASAHEEAPAEEHAEATEHEEASAEEHAEASGHEEAPAEEHAVTSAHPESHGDSDSDRSPEVVAFLDLIEKLIHQVSNWFGEIIGWVKTLFSKI